MIKKPIFFLFHVHPTNLHDGRAVRGAVIGNTASPHTAQPTKNPRRKKQRRVQVLFSSSLYRSKSTLSCARTRGETPCLSGFQRIFREEFSLNSVQKLWVFTKLCAEFSLNSVQKSEFSLNSVQSFHQTLCKNRSFH